MTFNKAKVFTALNADELKIGSKVIVANSISKLQQKVNTMEYEQNCEVITWIGGEDHEFRFCISGEAYLLAYLVEEPQEQYLKWTDVKIGDIIRRKSSAICYMIIAIDIGSDENVEYEDERKHIRISGLGWISDYLLKDFEIVKE